MKKLTVSILIFLSIFFVYSVECDTVALWLLDDDLIPEEELPELEMPGTIVHDLSGNEISGKINGGARFVKGKYNSALEFDGENDFVDFGVAAPLEEIDKQMTIEAWVKTPEAPKAGNTQTIVGQFQGLGELQFSIDDGHLRGIVTTKFTWGVGDPNPFPVNEWVHTAVTYDGEQLKLYRNGVEVASKAVKANIDHSLGDGGSGRYMIGASAAEGRRYFTGLVDEVRISDVALPPEKLGFFKRLSREGVMHIIEVEDEDQSVEAADKLATTWSQIKTRY